jgi:hypothetical protein
LQIYQSVYSFERKILQSKNEEHKAKKYAQDKELNVKKNNEVIKEKILKLQEEEEKRFKFFQKEGK